MTCTLSLDEIKNKETQIHNTKKISVATIQINLEWSNILKNHDKMMPFLHEAKKNGAELIVLPELFASGYFVTKEIWDSAETMDGPTVSWLKDISVKFNFYTGAGIIETDGKNFFNSFVLIGPNGDLLGKVRKNHAEAYVFKRGKWPHIINTKIGKVGIGICGDNQYKSLLHEMYKHSIDIMLMPHAWPTPHKITKSIDKETYKKQHKLMKELPLLYAKSLSVPVIFVNQIGSIKRMPGIFGKLMTPENFKLEGSSRIVDYDGNVKGELQDKEGVIIAEVTLNSEKKYYKKPRSYGENLFPGSAFGRKIIIPLDVFIGQAYYFFSTKRRKKSKEKNIILEYIST